MPDDLGPAAPLPARRPKKRPDAAARRRAILDAALEVFTEHGFTGARMEDVARRAGIAKGTLYLYFEDKTALFEGLVHDAADPILGTLERDFATFEGPTRDFLIHLFRQVEIEALATPRRHIIRLMLAEGERFPRIADFYYRDVVSRGLGLLRAINARALERGEITSDAGMRFPQLLVAPLLVAATWDGLFGRNEPLDMRAMFVAHAELVMRGLGWREA